MRNFTKYAEEGQKKIRKHSHYDMQITDYRFIEEQLKSGTSLFEVLEMVFHAGVEAGSRIEKKSQAKSAGRV